MSEFAITIFACLLGGLIIGAFIGKSSAGMTMSLHATFRVIGTAVAAAYGALCGFSNLFIMQGELKQVFLCVLISAVVGLVSTWTAQNLR